jgi:CubicO group peptidase (beta-lactamase class C family)
LNTTWSNVLQKPLLILSPYQRETAGKHNSFFDHLKPKIMKRFIYLWPQLIGLLIIAVAYNTGTAFGQGFSQQTQNKLQQVLQTFQNDPSFVGGISASINVDGLAVWNGASGYAARNVDANNNLLPGGSMFTTSTLSRIFSVSKTFAAPLILELQEEGKLSLNDQVSKYVPLSAINAGLDASVTIRQLLAHESGWSDFEYDEIQFQMAIAFDPTHHWTPFEILFFVHQVAPRGSVRHYSSTNYITLGAIAEIVTGKSVAQLYRERFFTPLGLTSMYYDVVEHQPSGTVLAAPHENLSPFNPIFQYTGQPTFPDAYTNISRFPYEGIASAAGAGGAVISTASDLAKWGNALFNARATSKAILDTMLNSIYPTPDAQGDYLGYGIWKSTVMGLPPTFIGHNGNAPGYRSTMFYHPDEKYTVVVLTNYHGTDAYAIAKALVAALPEFTGGNPNRKDEKITLCFNGKSITVDRNAADGFVKKGAYLGNCEKMEAKVIAKGENVNTVLKGSFEVSPNPSSGQMRFTFAASESGPASLELYDANGKMVSNVFRGNLQKGVVQQMSFAKGNLPAGVYIGYLKTTSGVTEKRIILTK